MKKTYLILSLIFLAAIVSAQKVDIGTAQNVAANYYSKNKISTSGMNKEAATIKYCQVENTDTLFYIFNIGTDGFVIVSGDYSAPPILAFSDEGNFNTEQQAPGLTDWLNGFASAIRYIKTQSQNNTDADWNIYNNENTSSFKVKTAPDIAPLVTTKWDQGAGYNYHCPAIATGPGGKCYAGCVATAMAQIMKYYNYPEHGYGSHSYYHPYFVSISADFDSTYYSWADMTNVLTTASREAISTLIFDCGVAVDMDYMPTGSAASMSNVPTALSTYFHYRPCVSVLDKNNYNYEDWWPILMDELEMAHPIMYSGSGSAGGHAWVCDGVKDSTLFHFNWGWSGYNNGYFNLTIINSGNGDFTAGQQAVINFVPVNAPYCLANRVLTEPAKNIGDGSGYSKYWNNTSCDWVIQPPNADKIVLTFNQFQTESQKDIVTIYDGTTYQSPLLGTFSGHNIPPTLVASSGSMLISFTSDEQTQDYGWEASYSSVVTGIDETNVSDAVVLYPVPATRDLTLVHSSELNGVATANIFNITGQLVQSINIQLSGSNIDLDISTLNPGIYTIIINTGKYCIHKKFVKE